MSNNAEVQFPPSLWADTAPSAQPTPALQDDTDTDVVIVGAGFTGLRAALELADNGTSVVVLDAEAPGWGASGRNGGQVNPLLPVHSPEDVYRMIGRDAGERLVQAAIGSADELFSLIKKHNIACEARQAGWIRTAHCAGAAREFTAQCESWQRAGVEIDIVDRATLAERAGTEFFGMGAIVPSGGCIQPLSYVRGLLGACLAAGARVHGKSRVTGLRRQANKWVATTNGASVRASKVLLCTNGYTDRLWPGLAETIVPVLSVQLATEPLSDNIRGSMLRGGETLSDTRRLIYYGRFDAAGRFLLGSVGSKDTFADAEQYTRTRREAIRIFPQLAEVQWKRQWCGYIAVTKDHLPHMHEPAPGVLAGLGFNGRGVAMSGVMGRALARRVLGASEQDLPFPVTGFNQFPLHAFHRIGVLASLGWYGLRDRLELRSG